MLKQKNERLASIDLLRVLAIALVLFFHLIYEFEQNLALKNIGFVGISLFFIVSGFLLAKRYPAQENFSPKWLYRRYVKIAPLYYISLIMVVLLFSRQVFSVSTLKNLLYHFLFIDFISPETAYSIISPAWFLVPLIGLYILFPYLNRIIKRAPGIILLFFLLVILLRIDKGTLTGFSPFFFLGEFTFGILVAHQKKHPILISSLLTSLVLPIMALPYAIFYFIHYFKISVPAHKITAFIGANTLAIFLLHESFMKTALGKWRILSLDPIPGLVILAVATFLTITVSKKVEKMATPKRSSKQRDLSNSAIVVAILLVFGFSVIAVSLTGYKDISFSPSEIKIHDISTKVYRTNDGCMLSIKGYAENLENNPQESLQVECREKLYPIPIGPIIKEMTQINNLEPRQTKKFEIHTQSEACVQRRFDCDLR